MTDDDPRNDDDIVIVEENIVKQNVGNIIIKTEPVEYADKDEAEDDPNVMFVGNQHYYQKQEDGNRSKNPEEQASHRRGKHLITSLLVSLK